jgi:hypothetical protein
MPSMETFILIFSLDFSLRNSHFDFMILCCIDAGLYNTYRKFKLIWGNKTFNCNY